MTITDTIKDKLKKARFISKNKNVQFNVAWLEDNLLEIIDAAEKAERYEEALLKIATTPYRIYDGNRPYVSDHDSGYAMGVADGHRLAAKWAQEALAHKTDGKAGE